MVLNGTAMLRLTRPKQWLKNSLVAFSPLMAGTLFEATVLVGTIFGVVVFIVASAAVYVFNDLYDVEADREHPKKKHRPIAAGEVSISTAWVMAILLAAVSLLAPILLGMIDLAVVLAVYLGLQLTYCVWLKHTPLIDISLIASGFLLRAIAGGVASDAGVSIWFLLVVGFGSFYIAAGKRFSELLQLQHADRSLEARRVLAEYSADYLRLILSVSLAAVVVFYSLWAAQLNIEYSFAWPLISIAPLALALFRYQYEVDRGRAESPEDVVTGDRLFLIFAVAWFLIVIAGLYFVPTMDL